MGNSKYVGRVGALAVVLGVGFGLAISPITACADDSVGDTVDRSIADAGIRSDTDSTAQPAGSDVPAGTANAESVDGVDSGDSIDGVDTADGGDSLDVGDGGDDLDDEDGLQASDSGDGNGVVIGDVETLVGGEDAAHPDGVEQPIPMTPTAEMTPTAPVLGGDRRDGHAGQDRHLGLDATAAAHELSRAAELSVGVGSQPDPAAPSARATAEPPTDSVPAVPAQEPSPLRGAPLADLISFSAPDSRRLDPADGAPLTSAAMFLVAAGARRELQRTQTTPTASLAWLTAPGLFTGRVYGDIRGLDADRDPLRYNATTPAHGTVTINRYGTFTYTPTAVSRHRAASATATDEDKTDMFTVTVSDGNGGTAEVVVMVAVKPANARPNARSTVNRPDPVSGVVTGTIVATDRDGDTLAFDGPTSTANGSVVINDDGSFLYTPTAQARRDARNPFRRLDAFSVTVDDGHGGTVSTRVFVAIAPLSSNSAPRNGSATFDPPDADGVVHGTLQAVDDNGDELTFGGSTVTGEGTVDVTGSGRFTYRPSDSARLAAATTPTRFVFTATVSDGRGGSSAFTVDLPISPVQLSGEQPATGVVTVANPSGGELVFEIDDDSDKGTATVDLAGAWTFAPTPQARHQAAADAATISDKLHTFSVTVTDELGNVTVVAITVGIAPANEVPETEIDPAQQPDPGTGTTTGVLRATDADGDRLTVNIDADPAQGVMTYDIDTGAWSFEATPEARHAAAAAAATRPAPMTARGFAAFAALATPTDPAVAVVTFTFRDGYGGVQVIPLEVQISPANEEPVIANVAGGRPDSTTGRVTGTVAFADGDDDLPLFAATTSARGIEVTIDAGTGAWSYTPTVALRQAASSRTASIDDRMDTFSITADDGHGGIATVAVTVPVLFSTRVDGTLALTGSVTGAPVVSADGTHVYVATGSPGGTNHALSVIDTTTKSGYLVPLSAAPTQPVLISADGSRAFATASDTVYVIDTATGTSRTVPLPGTGYHNLVVSPDGSRAYATSEVAGGFVVTSVNASTGTSAEIALPGTSLIRMAMSDDGAGVYVQTGGTDGTGNALTLIDTSTGSAHSVPLPDHVWNYATVSADGTRAYALATYQFDDDADDDVVPVYGSDLRYQLVIIDTATGGSQSLQFFDQGESPNDVLLSQDGRYAYAITSLGDHFYFMRIDTVEQHGSGVLLEGSPVGMWLSADGARGHIATEKFDSASASWRTYLRTTDEDGGAIIALPPNTMTSGMLFSPDGSFAYAASYTPSDNGFDYSLRIIETASGLNQRIAVTGVLYPMSLSGDGTRVIGRTVETVAGVTEHSLVVVDTVTETVSTAALRGNVIDDRVRLSADGSRAYVLTWDTRNGATAYMLNTVSVPTPTLPSSGVIDNPLGVALTYTVNDDGSRGTVVVGDDGNWTFTPNEQAAHRAAAEDATVYDKQHTFTVTVTDAEGNDTIVTLTAGIAPVNQLPVLDADGSPDVDPVTGVATGVFGVSDPDGDVLAVDIDVDPRVGTVAYDPASGVWTFVPTPDARHAAASTTTPADPGGPSDSEPGDTDEVAEEDPDDTDDTDEDETVDPVSPDEPVDPDTAPDPSEPSDGSSSGDSSSDGSSSGDASSDGSSSGHSSGERAFVLSSSSTTADARTATIVFTVSDGHGGIQVTTVPVPISPANEAPVVAELLSGEPDPITGTVTGTIALTDGDNDSLTVRAVSAKGVTVEIDSLGAWSYTPSPELRQSTDLEATITFTVDDHHGGVVSASTTVSIAPAVEHPRIVGWPGGSLIAGSTGNGYALVFNEVDMETTVVVVTRDGFVTVAGVAPGATSLEWDGRPDFVHRADGGIAFLTFERAGGWSGDTTTRLVTVTAGGAMHVEPVGSQGRWLTAGDGTVYYVALVPRDDDDPTVAVWRLTDDGSVHVHSHGYEYSSSDGGSDAVVGPDGTLYLAVGQLAPAGQYRTRASLWTISPTGVEATYALTPLTGTDITDLSYPDEVALALNGTAYVIATTAAVVDDSPTQAAAVLVVEADGSVHRLPLPSVPAGAHRVVTVGDYGVVQWFDSTTIWTTVIDPSGNMTHHPHPTATGATIAATDGSGVYLGLTDGLVYVDPSGTVALLDVTPRDQILLAGPGGAVYVIDTSEDLVTLKSGVVTRTALGNTASFTDRSVRFTADGTLVLLVEDDDTMRLAVNGQTGPEVSRWDWPTNRFEAVGDMAVLIGQTSDSARLVAVTTDGTTLIDQVFTPPTGYLEGPVEFGPDGVFYVTSLEEQPGNVYITHVWAVDAAGAVEVFTAAGVPPGTWNPGAKTVTVGSDGSKFVTVTEFEGLDTILTKVYVI